MKSKNLRGIVAVSVLLAVVGGYSGLPDASGQGKAKTTATFELYKDNGGEFRFRLLNPEGNLIASSGKGYKTKAECQKVIEAVRQDAAKAKLDDQTK